jgi:HAD superfamily hydrolase (TIGR01662 family)
LLKAVFFDLDDTLFDHRYASRRALEAMRERYQQLAHVDPSELEFANLEILNAVHLDVLSGAIGPDEARERRFGALFNRFGVSLTSEELRSVAAWYRQEYCKHWRAVPGGIELLKELKARGFTTGIVSNNLLEEQLQKLRICNLHEHLDVLVISEEAGVSKPNARIYEIALERANAKAHETVMIGDAWENDIVGAQALGIRTIWYNCYGTQNPDSRVPEISSFEDSESILSLLEEASHAHEKSKGKIGGQTSESA